MTKRNLAIITLALGIVAGAAWWFTVKPKQEGEAANLTSELQRLEIENDTIRQQRNIANNAIPQLRVEIATLTAERDHYADRIPPEESLPQLLTAINTLSDLHAVQYRGIQQGAKAQVIPDIYQVNYTLSTLGQFNDQVNFVTDLQNLSRWVVVDSVNLSRSGSDPRHPIVTASISFRTFINGSLADSK